MPDFRLTSEPLTQPTCCYLCGGNNKPYVDTAVDKYARVQGMQIPMGHVLVCSLCVDAMTKVRGGLPPDQKDTLAQATILLHERIDELERLLAEAENRRVVSVDELQKLLPKRMESNEEEAAA